MFDSSGALRKWVSIACAPCRKAEKCVEADRQRDRQTDRRPHRITPADPIPEREHVIGIDPERIDRRQIGRHRHKMLCQSCRITVPQKPAARRLRIHHRLHRRKRLRRDDEQRRFRIDQRQHRIQIVAIDVGDEMHAQARMGKCAQRAAHHLGPQIGAADADIDDIGDRLAAMAGPVAGAHPIGKAVHPRPAPHAHRD